MKLSCYTYKNLSCEALRLQRRYVCSLGYVRYYGFIRPNAVLRYFWHFLTGSLPFGLPLQHWFSCSLPEPMQSSCHLNAAGCITGNQVPVMLGLSGSLPLRFYPGKSYFRHVYSGLPIFNSSANTILVLIVQLITLALTMSFSTIALYRSTTWRFDKFA
jgi:hypothetical protein